MTSYKQHLENIKALRSDLEAIGQFKPSYKGPFAAVEGTLTTLAATEGTMPVVARLKAQRDAQLSKDKK